MAPEARVITAFEDLKVPRTHTARLEIAHKEL
jgi:hypothetical protein